MIDMLYKCVTLRVCHSRRTLSISAPLPFLLVQVFLRGMLLRETFYAGDMGHKCPPPPNTL